MKCVSCLLQGREEIQGGRRGTESREALTTVDQGTERLLPLAGTFAGVALTRRAVIFPLDSSIISAPSFGSPGAREPFLFLGRNLVVTGELRHRHTEQKRAPSVFSSIVRGLRCRCHRDGCFAV